MREPGIGLGGRLAATTGRPHPTRWIEPPAQFPHPLRDRVGMHAGRHGHRLDSAPAQLRRLRGEHQPNNRGRPDNYAGHPKSIDIRDDAVAGVLARRVFGPQRAELLAADIAGADDRAVIERDQQRERLQRKIADIARRQNTIMRQARTLEPDDPYAQGLRETYNELHAERQAALAAVADLDKAEAAEPARPNPADAALLDALPFLAMNRPPEALLRQLYETLQLTVQVHPTTHEATVTVTLPADELNNIAAAATAAYPETEAPEHTESGSADDHTASVADVDGAPGSV